MQAASEEAAVARVLEAYRQAMLAGDADELAAICMDQLTYGHTTGLVESKAELIDSVRRGTTVWKSMAFIEPTHCVVGDAAISRCTLLGENESAGTASPVRFSVVMAWKKQGEAWRLLLRQGFNRTL
jgi:ketosteroid isomerase-like protein